MKKEINLTIPVIILTVILFIFKTTGKFNISYWTVFSPIWLPVVIILSIILTVLCFVILTNIMYCIFGHRPPYKVTFHFEK